MLKKHAHHSKTIEQIHCSPRLESKIIYYNIIKLHKHFLLNLNGMQLLPTTNTLKYAYIIIIRVDFNILFICFEILEFGVIYYFLFLYIYV